MLLKIFPLVFITWSCTHLYYETMESIGIEKREILSDRVDESQEEQEEAKEEFRDTLEKIRALYKVDGGELEDVYDQIRSDYDSLKERSDSISSGIDSVKEVAEDLFDEWETEANSINKSSLKRQSLARLSKTKTKFAQLLRAMRKVEKTMAPALTNLRDHMLALKHTLNAKAVGALRIELKQMEKQIDQLLIDIDRSVKEAQSFSKDLNSGSPNT